ncbi:MAG: leucine-rich repeat domain-containing protein [Mycoplasma sp.]
MKLKSALTLLCGLTLASSSVALVSLNNTNSNSQVNTHQSDVNRTNINDSNDLDYIIDSKGEIDLSYTAKIFGLLTPDMYIPNYLDGIQVKSLAPYMFQNQHNLGKVVLEEDSLVTRIPPHCFEGCSNLERVDLNPGIDSIAYNSFAGCTKLVRINITDLTNLTGIEQHAFDGCVNLHELNIPHTVTYIGSELFSGVNDFIVNVSWTPQEIDNILYLNKTYYVGDKGEEYHPTPFSGSGKGCKLHAKNLDAHSHYELEKKYAELFDQDLGHFQLIIDEDYSWTIDASGFITPIYRYQSVGNVTIPTWVNGQLVLGLQSDAFKDATELTSITFEPSCQLETIATHAFIGCHNITFKNLPTTLKKIEKDAFYRNWNITFTSNMTYGDLFSVQVQDNAFNEVQNLTINGTNQSNQHDVMVQLYTQKFNNKGELNLSVNVDPDINWEINEQGLIRPYWKAERPSGHLTIPTEVNHKTVRGILGYAFDNARNLVSVTIPSSITIFSEGSFSSCDDLRNIYTSWTLDELKNHVSVGHQIFINCEGPINIYAKNPDHFHHDQLLEEYQTLFANTGTKVTFIVEDDQPFEITNDGLIKAHNKATLSGKVSIPNNIYDVTVTGIADQGFSGSVNITSLTTENSNLKTIGTQSFKDSLSLGTVTISNTVRLIGIEAFANCYNLSTINCNWNAVDVKELTLYPDSFKGIDDLTINVKNHDGRQHDELLKAYQQKFNSTTIGVKNIKISVEENRVVNIDEDGLVSGVTKDLSGDIVIPRVVEGKEVKGIKENGFADTPNLTGVTIPTNVTSIGANAFKNCPALVKIKTSWGVSQLKTLTVDETAFYSNPQIIKIDAKNPDLLHHDELVKAYQLKFIAYFAFNIDVEADQPFLIFENGLITSRNKQYIRGSITIPSEINGKTVTGFADNAFDGCSELTSVSFETNTSLTSIGKYAFSNCSKLTTINLPNGLTKINNSAFYNCSELTAINIPNTVTSIEQNAFAKCNKLATVNFAEDIKLSVLSDGVFSGCVGLTTINLPNSLTAIGSHSFENCNKLVNVAIPNSVTNIGEYAFYNCSGLISFVLPENLKEIGKWAFSNCNAIKSISIPKNIVTINDGAFESCDSLFSVVFDKDSQLQTIGSEAFESCISLSTFNVPKSVNLIKELAFSWCSNLREFNTSWDLNDTNRIKIENNIFGNVSHNINVNVKNPYNQHDQLLAQYQAWFANSGATIVNYNVQENLFWVIDDNGYVSPSDKSQVHGEITIGDKTSNDVITGIANSAFSNCKDLTVVNLSNQITYVGNLAFANCASLKALNANWALADLDQLNVQSNIFTGLDLITINVKSQNNENDALLKKLQSIFTSEKTGAKTIIINIEPETSSLGIALGVSLGSVAALTGAGVITYRFKKRNKNVNRKTK